MIYIFDKHGRLIGLAFKEETAPPPIEQKFYNEHGRLIASVITGKQ